MRCSVVSYVSHFYVILQIERCSEHIGGIQTGSLTEVFGEYRKSAMLAPRFFWRMLTPSTVPTGTGKVMQR